MADLRPNSDSIMINDSQPRLGRISSHHEPIYNSLQPSMASDECYECSESDDLISIDECPRCNGEGRVLLPNCPEVDNVNQGRLLQLNFVFLLLDDFLSPL